MERKYEVVDNSKAVEALVAKVDEKGFTPLQEHFRQWVTERAAQEFKTAKERDAFALGAGYALVLRMEHQRSPENHAFKDEAREARAQEAAARPKRQPKAKAEPEVEAPAPKTRARRGAAKEETPAPARRGRRAAAATTAETEVSAPAAKATGRRAAATARPGRAARRGKAVEAEF